MLEISIQIEKATNPEAAVSVKGEGLIQVAHRIFYGRELEAIDQFFYLTGELEHILDRQEDN